MTLRSRLAGLLSKGESSSAYAPEIDGEPDPGEVVWAWVPYEEDPSQGKDRPVLVLDTAEHARELAKLMRRFDNAVQMKDAAKVNLIPFNPFPGTRFERSGEAEIRAFQKLLQDARVLTTVRRTRGDDIDAACGQLKGQVTDRTRRQAEFRKQLARASGDVDAVA